jgi:hypothetical protein
MTPQDFGMWAFATMAWVITVIIAVVAIAVVRNVYEQYWLDQQVRLRVFERITSGELEMEDDDYDD